MAQKFVSPGVFTNEVDQSFLAQGVAGIGAALIGRTLKGPAYVPTIVSGFDDFAARFGGRSAVNPFLQMPYAAKNYLANAGTLTVVRVLGSADGTSAVNGYVVGNITGISDGTQVLAVLQASGAVTVTGVPADLNNFVVAVAGFGAVTASFLTSSANYVNKVLNTDPTLYASKGYFLSNNYAYEVPAASASWSAELVLSGVNSFQRDYSEGVTAWVKSQPIGGTDFNLFRARSLGHGRSVDDDVKMEISNVKPSASPTSTRYGTFDVLFRGFYDTDQRQQVIETFTGCTMDPNSANYILRRIGDHRENFDTTQRKFIAQGNFPNKSKLASIELDTTTTPPPEALPWGHRGYLRLDFTGFQSAPLPLVPNQVNAQGIIDPSVIWGISYVSGGIVDQLRAFPNGAFTVQDPDFSLGNLTASYNAQGRLVYTYNAALPAAQQQQPLYQSASLFAFSLPFQGGFSGFDLRNPDSLYLNNVDDEAATPQIPNGNALQTGGGLAVISLKRSIDTIANPDAFDLNLLAIPGINNLKVTDYARAMVNNRNDVFYVMDITGSSVTEAVQGLQNRNIDDNYTGCYYPDLKMNDTTNNRIVRVAPSVPVMGAFAYSDKVSQPWFAPAGLNRAGLDQFDVTDVQDRLTFQDRNSLYDNRINPIATFPNEGIVIWGQKDLQIKASLLDRINVRRLLIYAKKTVASAAKYLVFEQDDPVTWDQFKNKVNPILDDVRKKRGLTRFKVVMDTTTNTPDLIDRNVMKGKIFLQPTPAAEFIDVDFVITPAGVEFGS